MGIIIRNGIPYGAADSKDITVVDRYSDLANLAVKQADHIYVVKNALQTTQSGYPHAQSFYYDESNESFKPIAEITGQQNQILVATGPTGSTHQLANWAHQNSISFFAEATQSAGSTPAGPTEFTIGSKTPSNVYPVAFGHIGESITTPPSLTSLKSGYLTRDSAKEKIAGTAQINIGEDNTDYTSDNRKFWSKDLTGPRIDIGGTAVIEMEGTGKGSSNSDTPVLSMRGRCLVDMCGSRTTSSQEVGYGRARTASWWPHVMDSYEQDPFDSTKYLYNNTVAYPYLHMHDESTILMDGAPFLNMRGNSLLSINGDVCIDINGRNPVNRPSFPGAAAGYGDVAIDIRPGTAIQIGTGNESTSSNPTTSMIRLTKNQFVVASALPKETNVSNSSCISQLYMDTTNGYATSYEGELFPFKYTAMSGNTSGIFNFYDSSSFTKWDASTMNQKIGQWAYTGVWGEGPGKNVGPVVWMQGKSRLKIGDGGTFSGVFGGRGNVSISMEPDTGSSAEIYMGSASYSADVINIANQSNSFTTFHHGAAPQAATKYEFTPSGNTMFRFNPKIKFFANVDCSNTEMLFQWSGMYGFFQGNNNYALLDGAQTHLENVGNTFIMRDDITQEIYAEKEGQNTSSTIYKFKGGYQPSGTALQDITSLPADAAAFVSSDMYSTAMTEFNSAKSSLPNGAYIDNPDVVFYAKLDYNGKPDTYYSPYNTNYYRYFDFVYPMRITLKGADSAVNVEFDSTEAIAGTSDYTYWYTMQSTTKTAIINNADFINALSTLLGADIWQYKYELDFYNAKYQRTTTENGYHYKIAYMCVILHQSFTVQQLWNSTATPSAPSSGYQISTYDEPYNSIAALYNSNTLPTNWELYTNQKSGTPHTRWRLQTYAAGSVTGLDKWRRGAYVNYTNDPQANVAWSQPVQTGESGDTKTILQMYNRANLMMRADTINKPYCNEYVQKPCTDVYEYTFTPSETYTVPTDSIYQFTSTTSYGSGVVTSESGINTFIKGGSSGTATDYKDFVEYVKTTEHDGVWGIISIERTNSSSPYAYTVTYKKLSQKVAIGTQLNTFINGADYSAFTTYLTTNYPDKELWRIVDIASGTGGNLVIRFTLKDASYTEYIKTPVTDDPVLEMVGRSELRMYGGAYIKGETKYGETVFTFGSTTSDEPPVSFTLAQLAAAISGGGTQLPNAADAQF